MSITVCAFVLTRNRKELLVECVRALLGQTRPPERVLILDNASTDGTEALLRAEGILDRPEVTFHRMVRNTGGAGGYSEGVRIGAELGTDWLWLMDDDAEPRPDALERLLAAPPAGDPGTAVLCNRVETLDGSIDVLHRCSLGRFIRPLPKEAYIPGRYVSVGAASFVGFMVRTDVVREVGLPRAEFFIAYDDADYSIRVRPHGAILLVPESVIVHKLTMGGGSATRRSRLWNRALGLDYSSSSWPGFWKNLYGIRNFVWIKQHYGRLSTLAFVGVTLTYIVKSLLYDRYPLRRVPWIVRFAAAGRRGDFSGPSPEEWARIAAGSGAPPYQ